MLEGLRILVGICIVSTLVAAPTLADRVSNLDSPTDAGEAAHEAGCSPISSGIDVFPSTARLVINDNGFGEPFVVRLSSAGAADAMVQRGGQIADTIDTEILQLELTGYHPRTGPITLRQSPTSASLGQIRDVEVNGACQLSGGLSVFDLFFEIEVTNLGETWINLDPVRIEAPITEVPPGDTRFEVPFAPQVALKDKSTNDPRGEVFYIEHHTDPAFPAPGADCFDTLLTADLFLYGPATNVPLFGFGPTSVHHGATDPGGTCKTGGGPCDDDNDCSVFDSCLRQSLETEIVAMNLGGFDAVLGNWSMAALPDLGDSDCCVANGTPGCTDDLCEALICGMDPFCCSSDWDSLCAALANTEPTCVAGCDNPDAAPSFGTVQSVSLDRTYPANATFDVFVEIESTLHGTFRNQSPVPLQKPSMSNIPPDPETVFTYSGAAIPMVADDLTPIGEISNVAHTVQIPQDCVAPPAAGHECLDSWMEIELTLPPCTMETVLLSGEFRTLRDAPAPGAGLGQDVIETLMAKAELSGIGACSGAVTLRVSPSETSSGAVSSFAPEEFFPADAFFDVHVELETPIGTLAADPATLATTVNALPPDTGENYFGPAGTLDLRDEFDVKVGEIRIVRQEIQQEVVCPAACLPQIAFTGPTHDELNIGIPDAGGGVEYDVVRGDIDALRASGGSFASAVCLSSNVGPALTDGDEPASGAAFFYVSRDGFKAFDGTWNSPGAGQQGDRDGKIGPCP